MTGFYPEDHNGASYVEDNDTDEMLVHLGSSSGDPTGEDDDCRNCQRSADDRREKREVVDGGVNEHAGSQTGWHRSYQVRRVCPECGEVYG